MKLLFYSIAISTLFFVACNSDTSNSQANESTSAEMETEMSSVSPASDHAISDLLNGYMKIKNALVADNDKEAALAGAEMKIAFENFDKTSLTAEQVELYNETEAGAKENVEHIAANAGNIGHQREHFEKLSEEMYNLVKSVGAGRKLFLTHCPMYDDNRGANWLSEVKEVQNPYFGQTMANCGSVEEEL